MSEFMDGEMGLKTFRGRTMSDALSKVKQDLGRDAVILHTRCFKQSGMLGLGGREGVEITATRDERLIAARRQDSPPAQDSPQPPGVTPLSTTDSAAAMEETNPALRQAPGNGAAMLREIQSIRDMVCKMLGRVGAANLPESSSELVQLYTRLVSQSVSDELAREIIQRVRDKLATPMEAKRGHPRKQSVAAKDKSRGAIDAARVEQELQHCIEEMLPPATPIELIAADRPTVVALVGPTGVGKTTTLAKIAATMKLRESKRVGFVTLDTYRIAAVEQLRTYANILKLPMAVVRTPEELPGAMEGLGEVDLVLIDTAGRSQRDVQAITELSQYVEAARPDQVHLVLSSVSREETIRDAVEAFSRLGTTHVILTKLDEAAGFGVLLNVLHDVKPRLSYLTTGQSVPDDIEVGSSRRLARLLLGLEAAAT